MRARALAVGTVEGSRDTRVVAALRLVSAALTALVLVVVGRAIGSGVASNWSLLFLAALGAALAASAETWYAGSAGRREERRVRRRMMSAVFDSSALPRKVDSAFESGRLVSMLTDNVERMAEFRQVYMGSAIAAILIPFLTAGYIAVAIDPVVGWVLVGLFPLIPVLIGVFMMFFRKTSVQSRRQRARLSGQYLDAIRNLETIRLFGAGGRVEAQLRDQGEKNRGAIMKILAGNQIVIIVLDGLFSLLLICASVALAVMRFRAGAIDTADVVTITLLTVLLIDPLTEVAGFFYIGMGGIASQKALKKYLAASQEGQPTPQPAETLAVDAAGDTHIYRASNTEAAGAAYTATDAAIQIEHVSYDYGRGEVLSDVSLTVPRGQKVAIVGPSGEGKSTLLSLVRGSLPVQSGTITVDSHDCACSRTADIRALSATVSQQTWLFTGTVADNLRLADPSATEEEMWEALRRAHVADEVARMPRGLDTEVGEQGTLISGGQAQRLSLARALLSGRRVLLLDEPTSHVDLESEQQILRALDELGDEWTVLMVTHRSSVVSVADSVYELNDGALVPMGGQR